MNTFIRDKKTGDVYHVDLYEKWWYYFFLCFAAFLPQHGTKVYESEFKELHQYNVKKVKEGQTKNLILGIFISSVVASLLPKGVIYTVGEKYKFFLYFFTYLCLVLGTYLFTVHSKKSKCGQKMDLVLSDEKKNSSIYND